MESDIFVFLCQMRKFKKKGEESERPSAFFDAEGVSRIVRLFTFAVNSIVESDGSEKSPGKRFVRIGAYFRVCKIVYERNG